MRSTDADVPRAVTLEVNGIDVSVERKQIKHIHLAVYPPDGRVHVSAPLACPDERLRLYLLEKWVWIVEHRRQVVAFERQPPRTYVSGEAHYFRGDLYRLKVETDDRAAPGVSVKGDYLVLVQRPGSSAARRAAILSDWYKAQLAPLLDRYVAQWSPVLGVRPDVCEIRHLAKKWGTCSRAKRKILFSVELAKKPPACVEYVVVHELAHLLVPTHNADFLRILDRSLPDWRVVKRQLNQFPVSAS